MRRFCLYVSLSLFATTLLTACGQGAEQTGAIGLASPTLPATAVESVETIASLADALRANGVNVTRDGEVDLSFLRGKGELLRIDEQTVQVYEYTDEQIADGDAARFSLDGAWVSSDNFDALEGRQGAMLINWYATPHLYQASRLIAVYIGDHAPTLALLEDVLGAPFAGGANPYHSAALLQTEN